MSDYEILGRLYRDYAALRTEYAKLLNVAGQLAAGQVAGSRFHVLPGDSWTLDAEPQEAPAD